MCATTSSLELPENTSKGVEVVNLSTSMRLPVAALVLLHAIGIALCGVYLSAV